MREHHKYVTEVVQKVTNFIILILLFFIKIFYIILFRPSFIFRKAYKFLRKFDLHKETYSFILNFLFITLAGTVLTYFLTNISYDKQKKQEYYRFQLQQTSDVMELVSENINKRYLASFRFLSNVKSEQSWKNYIESVEEWNYNMEKIRQYLILYYGPEFAQRIIDTEADYLLKIPKTIHYKFVKLHHILYEIRSGDIAKIEDAQTMLKEITEDRDLLMNMMLGKIKQYNI